MKHKITLLTIAAIIICFISCKDDCNPNKVGSEEKLSSQRVLILFPYNGKEKLRFLKDGKDTVIFSNLGIVNGYNYITSQTDCPYQVPLQYKSMTFIDSISNNKFQLVNYISSDKYNYFSLFINNHNIFNDASISFILLDPPYKSVIINNIKYDTLTYVEKNSNYAYYKTYTTGMVKFKTDSNVFELIP
jgi:hypothetical protein